MSNTVEEGSGELGGFLRGYLSRSSLSQRALAAQIQIPLTTLRALMTGQISPTQGTRDRLQRAFGESVPLPPARTKHKCPTCRKPFRDSPSRRRVYCSRGCFAVGRRHHISPKGTLGQFLFDKWQASDLTLRAWSLTVGLASDTLKGLMQGHLPKRGTLAQLRKVYGDSLPETETAISGSRIQMLFAHQEKGRTPESRQKAARSMRGRVRTKEHVAKLMAARQANGAVERSVAAMTASSRSTRGRCRSALMGRLNGNPEPSRDQLQEWAKETAKKVELSTGAVLAEWKPYMEKRGLWNPAGRKPDERRHQMIEQLLANAPKAASGRVKRGTWDSIAREVGEAEGREWSGPELYEWHREHRKTCTEDPNAA